MKMIKHISVFVVIQMFFFLQANSQFKSRISLEIIDVNYNKGNVVVRYNINNSRQKDNIRVWINVFSSENDTIRAKSWRGDVNKFVNGEGEKTAIWDVGADGIGILDSIYVKVSASVQNGFYLDSPFILSTVFPGLGDYKINPKKPYWIYGALAYSFIGSSIYLNNYSYNTFINKYKPTETVQDKDTYFDLSKKTKTISYALIGAAGAIWAIDYYRLLKRTKQIKKAWEKSYPVRETPDIPSFKVTTSLSKKYFINTYLTNLRIVKNSVKYIDLDENNYLDAFEEGYLSFKIENTGPAKAINFYAYVSSDDETGNIQFPEKFEIGNIPLHKTKLVKIPIKANKKIKNGICEFVIDIKAEHNNPVPIFKAMVNTRKFNYNETVYRHTLISDIDRNIPSIKVINKNKYALIIGNEGYANKYTGLSKNFNVPYTRNDALIFKEYAVKMLGVPEKNITLLLDAGKNEMYESILTLSKQVRDLAGKGQLVFYYAGHGLADTIPTRRAPYLMPVDIPPSEIEDAISMEFLYTKIWESKSLKSIVFIDASFNNGGRNMGLRGPSAQIVNPRTELISGNTVVFSATTENHTANVFHDKKHGLFTYFLLKALKETRGNINLHKLYNSVKTNVEKKASALGKHQTPITLNSTAVDEMWQEWKVQ